MSPTLCLYPHLCIHNRVPLHLKLSCTVTLHCRMLMYYACTHTVLCVLVLCENILPLCLLLITAHCLCGGRSSIWREHVCSSSNQISATQTETSLPVLATGSTTSVPRPSSRLRQEYPIQHTSSSLSTSPFTLSAPHLLGSRGPLGLLPH